VWSDEAFTGPTPVEVEAPLERIPVLARAGAMVPTGPTMHYVGERPRDSLTLHVYSPMGPGAAALLESSISGTESRTGGESDGHTSLLYEDDGRAYAFRDGE
jgi:alpha-glucosidase (family GH31 glycosyl hydrolase)